MSRSASGSERRASALGGTVLVARREFVQRVRDKSFVISTLFVLLVVAAVVFAPRLLGFGDPASYDVGTTGPGSPVADDLLATAPDFGVTVDLVEVADLAAGERLLREGDLDLLVAGDELVVQSTGDQQLVGLAQSTARRQQLEAALADAGFDDAEVGDLLAAAPLPVRALEAPDEDGDALVGVAFIGLFLLYGQLFGYGFAVASGVVEEKSSRVVELLLSTISPTQLLAGKIAGIGLVGLFQLSLMAALGIGLVTATGMVDLPAGTGMLVLQLLGWFLLGYTLYSCIFAGVGALVSRTEELQGVMTPFTFVIMGGFFGSFAALNDPTSTVARVMSFLPPSAPMAMPIRVAQQAAAGWEIALAVGLLVAAILAVVPIGARLYSGGVLRTGGTLRYRDAWRSG